MTTLSMVVAMLPIALALEPGSEVRQALGVVVIGGLLSSLALTLLLVPVVYVAMTPKREPASILVETPVAGETGAVSRA
jgi:HAE1 family hydrophobic/amphiphilic exporter-1